jgi:hypothetical protein
MASSPPVDCPETVITWKVISKLAEESNIPVSFLRKLA